SGGVHARSAGNLIAMSMREQLPGALSGANQVRALICWAVWWARAMIVTIGLTPEEAGNALASAMNRPRTPKTSPPASQTAVRGSAPMRQEPIWWALKSVDQLRSLRLRATLSK